VPDSLVTPGRIVRCARCGNEWTPVLVVPDPPPDEPPDTSAEQPSLVAETLSAERQSAMERLTAHPSPPPPVRGLRIAWAVSLIVLVTLLGAAYVLRAQAVSVWPPSARVYALFGIHPASQ